MLEPELEEALKNATDAEMCDIAGGTPKAFVPSEAESQSCPFCPSITKR